MRNEPLRRIRRWIDAVLRGSASALELLADLVSGTEDVELHTVVTVRAIVDAVVPETPELAVGSRSTRAYLTPCDASDPMEGLHSRRTRLVVALLLVGLLCVYVLWHVIWTVFFALTFVYVLYPIRRNLVHRGLNARLVAATLTTAALIGVLALPAGRTVVRLLPPLTIEREHADAVVDALAEVIG
jgi:Flp pilus assembly protein TadB